MPVQFYLHQNYPNPFNSVTVIQYSINRKEHVKLAVYNLLGKEIAVLVDSQQPPGSHVVTWDGRDSFGHQVGSAVYFYKIEAGEFVQARKMMLLR
jgi:flagellar hook assembly protein FlgD